MEKMKFETPDMAQMNVEKIAALFPNCVTESKAKDGKLKKAVNFDALKQMLGESVAEGDESYEFTWVGKRDAMVEAAKPIRKTLRPCVEESKNFDTTENLYIEGDNLEALKLLQEGYLGKVKMIYIDPPYNTGNDFIYKDDFRMDSAKYAEESGAVDDEGNRMVQNSDSNGRFHSDWCSMIYSRLLLARNLLTDDGVIFISIDDNEQENLKKICDEVFGADSFINLIVAKTKDSSGASGGGEDKRLKKNVEFVLCYGKSNFKAFNPVYGKIPLPQYIKEYNDSGKSFKYTTVYTKLGERTYYKTIKDGSGADILIYKHSGYETKSVSKLAAELNISEEDVYKKYLDRICTTENAQTSIRTRVQEATDTQDTLYSIDYYPVSGRNKGALTTIYFVGPQKRLINWFNNVCIKEGERVFKKEKVGTLWTDCNWNNVAREGDVPFPNGKKSLDFIKKICSLVTQPNENCIVLDFFSGSATTAHAIMQMNAEDYGNRKFILVQLPEDLDIAKKEYQGNSKEIVENCISFLDENKRGHTICELGKERIRRAGDKILAEQQAKEKSAADKTDLFDSASDKPATAKPLDIGFRVLKIDDSNMKDVYYSAGEISQQDLVEQISNIKDGRTDMDLLFGCLVDWGVPLSLPIKTETIENLQVYNVNDGDLVACFANDIPEAAIRQIAAAKPLRAVFRDSSFKSDSAKINVTEIFKTISPNTTVKVV